MILRYESSSLMTLAGAALAAAAMTTSAPGAPTPMCLSQVTTPLCVAQVTYPRSPAEPPAPRKKLTGFFSAMSYHTREFPEITDEWEISRIRAMGGNAHRWLVRWGDIQPDGRFAPFLNIPLGEAEDTNPTTHSIVVSDRRYLTDLQAGLVPVIGIYHVPPWARALDSPGNINVPDLRPWDAFIRALALRYPRAVLEGFNEPNLTTREPGHPIPPARMAAMQVHMYRQVKEINPRQPVLGPSLTVPPYDQRTWGIPRYAAQLYASGMKGSIDGFSLHPYGAGTARTLVELRNPANSFTRTFREIRRAMSDAGDRVPLFVTELGVSMTGPTGVGSEAIQRSIIRKMHRRMAAMPDLGAEIYFALRDQSSPEMRPSDFSFGLGWMRVNGTPKPVYCSFVREAGHTYPGCRAAIRR
ncbi:MAG: hypothetical protein WKF96_07040 [Solirubrobacteraceae bacterium]